MKVTVSKHDGDTKWEETFTLKEGDENRKCSISIEKNGYTFEIGEQDGRLFIICNYKDDCDKYVSIGTQFVSLETRDYSSSIAHWDEMLKESRRNDEKRL